MGKIKLILGASALLFSSILNAGIITSGFFNPMEEVIWNGKRDQPLLLNMFDSSLGTLNYVILSTQLNVIDSLILDNDSPVSSTFDLLSYVSGDFAFSYGPSRGVSLRQETVTLGGDDGDGAGGQNGGADEREFVTATGFDARSRRINNTHELDFYSKAGGGTLVERCDFRAKGVWNLPKQIEASRMTLGACGATIEYHFTEASVPEPSAILLFGIGMIGLIGFSKRRKVA